MSFVGRLDQFKLSDVLQILAMGEKSGKIKLTQRDADGVIVLRRGKILYAASSSARETLGHILICEKKVEEADLMRALEMQHKSVEEKRLGVCLVEMGAISQEALDAVIIRQIEKVIAEFMKWRSGYFKFEPMGIESVGEVGVDAENLLLTAGLSAEKFLLNTDLEELEEDLTAVTERPSAPLADLASLKSIMNEIRSAEFTGEATWKILRFAQKVLRRGVFFVVRSEDFAGMGQFGVELEGGEADEVVRATQVPAGEPSILSEAAERKETVRGPLADIKWNRYLVERLGGGWPREAVAIPMIIEDRVFLLFYGDNGARREPISSTDELELLIIQVGLATEKKLLEKRLAQLEGGRGGRKVD